MMFCKAESFDQDVSGWDISGVEFMKGMFAFAEAFNRDLSRWDMSHVKDYRGMFYKAVNFNYTDGWDTAIIFCEPDANGKWQ